MIIWSLTAISTAGVVYFTLLFLFPTLLTAFHIQDHQASRPSPVILIPGDGGSQLEAKLDKPETVHYFCNKKTDFYFGIWLNLELLVPYVLDCWVDNMRMVYDNVTRTTTNAPGVDIRAPGFGNTTSVEWLDPSQISPSSYFSSIVQMLVAQGYKRGIDVRGAPYDYRKAPNEMGDYYKAMKNLTEETYEKNDRTRITYICHSMGCPIMMYFFNHQTQEWKEKYVKALVTLGGAFGGAVKAMKAFAAGENLGVFVINQLSVRKEQRTCPSLAYMLPSDTLWDKDEVLVIADKKNYTVQNFSEFFSDIGFSDGYEMWKDTYNLTRSLTPPGVEVHCIHGVNVTNTIERLKFTAKNFPDDPELIYGDGDGTVNVRSLQACLQWQGKQKHDVYHVPLSNVDHMAILADQQVLDYVNKVVHK